MAYTLLRIVCTIAGRQAALDAHVRAGNRAELNAHPVLTGRDTLRFSAGCGKCRRRFHPGRQAAASYGQEPIRNLCPGVLPLPPEVLVLWNAFLFQQGLDCCPFLPGLALDLFDLFACKHVC